MAKRLAKHLPLRPHYYGCPKCRSCCITDESADYQPLCPSYHYYRSVAASGAGANKLAANLFEGNLPLSRAVADTIYKCTMCGGCDQRCPMSCRPMLTNLLLRRELVAKKLAPPEPLRRQRDSILRHHNPFGRPHRERYRPPDHGRSLATAEYVVYVGCHLGHRQRATVRAAGRVLDRLGVAYHFFAEESCCGFPLYQMGYEREAEKLAAKQARLLARTGRTILFLCPSCFHNFKVVRKSDLPMVFFSELVAELLADVELRTREHQTVTYHDPCVLGRGCGIYDAPRQLLAQIGGVEQVEMARARESAWCCGAGAGSAEHQPDLARWAATQRIDEALATGANTLLTSCPMCRENLERCAGDRLEVKDLADFLDQALAAKE